MRVMDLKRHVVGRDLERARVLSQFRSGELRASDICDATSSLIASAEVLGHRAERLCPVCGSEKLYDTRWIHGELLGEKSGTARSVKEIDVVLEDFSQGRLQAEMAENPGEITVHIVEVCLHCRWNFLVRVETFSH
ncbi:hypothetical protein CAURIC_11235 [Corynebacterium auriscanis]|uniref:DUF5318 domain-containing protein n=2 Tax=Corynebacteriaceae TaxID=1653 RepID=A0A0A2DMR1_9CORY|nr:hypothetical protein MA47_08800 [Corynebacterium auriscanis]WJY73834.1 hypothetical protein CAURIC_11235 [Corynebacterium auriscanis]